MVRAMDGMKSGMKERFAHPFQEVRDRGRRLAELNIELMKAEMARVAGKYGAAIGMFVGAALLAFFGLGFVFATIAVALDIVLPLWAAMLIVTVLLFLLVALLVLIGKALVQSVKSTKPEKAIAEAKATAKTAKEGARSVVPRRKKKTDAEAPEAATTGFGDPATPSPVPARDKPADTAPKVVVADKPAATAAPAVPPAGVPQAAQPKPPDVPPPAGAPQAAQPKPPEAPPSVTGGDSATE
jgi:hypothetical protein